MVSPDWDRMPLNATMNTDKRNSGPSRLCPVIAAGVGLAVCLAAIVAVWLYVVFYPVLFADRLFEPTEQVVAQTAWGEWRAIDQLPKDMASRIASPEPVAFREGRFQSPLHEFVVIETKSASGAATLNPGLLSFRIKVVRLVVCTVVGVGMCLGVAVVVYRAWRREFEACSRRGNRT